MIHLSTVVVVHSYFRLPEGRYLNMIKHIAQCHWTQSFVPLFSNLYLHFLEGIAKGMRESLRICGAHDEHMKPQNVANQYKQVIC